LLTFADSALPGRRITAGGGVEDLCESCGEPVGSVESRSRCSQKESKKKKKDSFLIQDGSLARTGDRVQPVATSVSSRTGRRTMVTEQGAWATTAEETVPR
jgi:hypothetical protein